MSGNPLPSLPEIDLTIPSSPNITTAFAYTQQYTPPAVYNHTARTVYWALLLAKKLPQFGAVPIDEELVVLAALLHDLGFSASPELVSKDKRFEVDGANAACSWLAQRDGHSSSTTTAAAAAAVPGDAKGKQQHHHHQHGSPDPRLEKDIHTADVTGKSQTLWDAIALHATPSLARHHPRPEVVLVHLGTVADFCGPRFSLAGSHDGGADDVEVRSDGQDAITTTTTGTIITEAEYGAVLRAFPLVGFGAAGVRAIMCGLCRAKPEACLDNFVAEFGMRFGIGDGAAGGDDGDGDREGRKLFVERVRRARDGELDMLLGSLEWLEGFGQGA